MANDQAFLGASPASQVGGHVRPRRLFCDPFASPILTPGMTSEASNEDAPMAPLQHRLFRPFDDEDEDDPKSDIGAEDLIEIRRKYLLPDTMELRCADEFERATDGGMDEIAIFEAYLEAGFRGGIPFLIAEVASYFGFSPSQLTPATWRTLMAIQVLGEFHSIPFGLPEILYSYSFVPLPSKRGLYQIWSRDGEPLVDEPPRGVRGSFPSNDSWNRRYVFMKINGTPRYPLFWRSVEVARPVFHAGETLAKLAKGISRRFRWIPFLMSRMSLRHSRIWGGIPKVSISSVYDEYCRATPQRRRSYVSSPFASSVATSSTSRNVDGRRSFGLRRRVPPHEEILFLRNQLREVITHQALTVQRVREQARWELVKEWSEGNVNRWEPGRGTSRWGPVGGPSRWGPVGGPSRNLVNGGGGSGAFPSASFHPEPMP